MTSRPADLCRELLAALEAAEGRRRRRKRDQTPDTIGIALKRDLLEAAIREDPDSAGFEGWLLECCQGAGPGTGAVRAMAMEVLADWRLAAASPDFRTWLGQGAPSDDRP